ncbi:MAG: hypothetical protein QE570_18875 [Verrucomicrobiota bacterium]|jgi:hypothetical protein|nr:hypothetical protein [Verrucomicrobiota bacterium]
MIWTAPSEKDTALTGFERDFRPFAPRHAEFVIPSASWQHVIHRLAPHTAMLDSAISQRKASPQVVSQAKNNMAAHSGLLFDSTPFPVCLWFLVKDKSGAVHQPASCSSQSPDDKRKRCPTSATGCSQRC